MENIAQTISTLTSMIEINNERMKVYRSLAEKMHHNELRSLFTHNAEQSRQFANTLSTWRAAYGGFGMPEKKSKVLSKLTSLLDHWLRKNVASKCEGIEQNALKAYRSAIQMSFLPAATAGDIEQQSKEFEKALGKLRTLRQQPNKGGVGEELLHAPAF